MLSNHKALLLLHLAKSLPTTIESSLKAVVLIDYKFGKSIIKALWQALRRSLKGMIKYLHTIIITQLTKDIQVHMHDESRRVPAN